MESELFICDFSGFKKYWDPRTNSHIPYKEGRGFIGDPLYASINHHLGIERSRRDDLESLAYVALSMLKGEESIPWANYQRGIDDQKNGFKEIMQFKIDLDIDTAFAGFPCMEYSIT